MQRNCAFLAVGLVPSLTPLQARSLLEHHHFEPERIFSSSVAELCGIEGISRKNARAILRFGLVLAGVYEYFTTKARITPI